MSVIFQYIRNYYRSAFHAVYFMLILLLAGTLIYLNYRHELETWLVNRPWGGFAGYYLLFLFPFATAFLLQPLFFKECKYLGKPWFWIILFLAPAFFAFRVNFDLQDKIINKTWTGDEAIYWSKTIGWVVRVFVVLVPVWLLWFVKDRKQQSFYGTKKTRDLSPYWLMLMIMIPLVALASTQHDFLSMYPRAHFMAALKPPPERWQYLLYELSYGFDFVSIEFFFRGFLILSLINICGPNCILPMACFYCTIHFGKPMGEAISSFWGGLLLGIISFHTRSIWGGLLVHLGIAWLMEAGGWLGRMFFS